MFWHRWGITNTSATSLIETDNERPNRTVTLSRDNIPCKFNNGITQNDFEDFAKRGVKGIKRIRRVSVDGAIIHGTVVSQSNISEWEFEIDFNDYGNITGSYWVWSENYDSKIPRRVAENIKNEVERFICENGFKVKTGEIGGNTYSEDELSDILPLNQNEAASSTTPSFVRRHWLILSSIVIGLIALCAMYVTGIIPPARLSDNQAWLAMFPISVAVIALSFSVLIIIKSIFKLIKRFFTAIVICLLLVAAVFTCRAWRSYNQETAIVPISSESVVGKDLQDVYIQFIEAGFDHVLTADLKDLLSDNLECEGTVKTVSVNGKKTFSKNEQALKHANVVIEYHSISEAMCPISSADAEGLIYLDVVKQFEDAGFLNVSAVPQYDLVLGLLSKENTISVILIGEEIVDFECGEAFIRDIPVVIEYHSFKTKHISREGS